MLALPVGTNIWLSWAIFSNKESPISWLECGGEFPPVQEEIQKRQSMEERLTHDSTSRGEVQSLGAGAKL